MAGGWSKSLEVLVDANVPAIRDAMAEGYYDSGIGVRSGRLLAAIRNLSNYSSHQRKGGSFDKIKLVLKLPYARIQNAGGRVPARMARKGSYMTFQVDGQWVKVVVAKGFTLPGFQYVDFGKEELINRMGRLFEVKWK